MERVYYINVNTQILKCHLSAYESTLVCTGLRMCNYWNFMFYCYIKIIIDK